MKRIRETFQQSVRRGGATAVFLYLLGAGQLVFAVQVFHDRTLFLNATGPLLFEGFESLPANNLNSLTSITAADFTVEAPAGGLGIFNTPISGQSATEGNQFLDHQSGLNETTEFTFDFPIDSFGFDLIDYGDFGSGQLTLMNNAGDNAVVAVAGSPDGNVQYFGIISDFFFTEAVFTNTIGGEAFGFDRMNYGTSVPEPSVFALLGLGLAGVVVRARRRREVPV